MVSGLVNPYMPPPDGCYFVTVALEDLDAAAPDVDFATLTTGGVPDPGGSGFDLFGFGVPNSSCGSTPGGCPADTLCLDQGRFQVKATFDAGGGNSGQAHVVSLTDDTGYLWFFKSSNVEAVVKVLNGCGLGGHYWVFAGGLTNVNVVMTVTDTQTGAMQTYINPPNTTFQPIQDTNAFDTCP